MACGSAAAPVSNEAHPVVHHEVPAPPLVDHLYGQREGAIVRIDGVISPAGSSSPWMSLQTPLWIKTSSGATEAIMVHGAAPACHGEIHFVGEVKIEEGPVPSPRNGTIYEPLREWYLDAQSFAC